MLCSKNRVNPLKSTATIPRLRELYLAQIKAFSRVVEEVFKNLTKKAQPSDHLEADEVAYADQCIIKHVQSFFVLSGSLHK